MLIKPILVSVYKKLFNLGPWNTAGLCGSGLSCFRSCSCKTLTPTEEKCIFPFKYKMIMKTNNESGLKGFDFCLGTRVKSIQIVSMKTMIRTSQTSTKNDIHVTNKLLTSSSNRTDNSTTRANTRILEVAPFSSNSAIKTHIDLAPTPPAPGSARRLTCRTTRPVWRGPGSGRCPPCAPGSPAPRNSTSCGWAPTLADGSRRQRSRTARRPSCDRPRAGEGREG